MTAQPSQQNFAIDDFLHRQEQKGLLRLIACGSVDHGKSSLLGRLLYEAKPLLDDQLATLESDTRRHGGKDGELDYSLLLDGLTAEREQKITIDVAYRFFSTDKRKFIVIDAPGHEQYTRNMATGASNADLALILIDAESGFTAQTRRHSLLVSMLGVRRIVVAVNKMDLVGWSQQRFAEIEREFRSFARDFDVDNVVIIPLSARAGDNVVRRSANMRWYGGPTLLEHLENVSITPKRTDSALRMPVQWVNRPDANFRGYSGTIAGGVARPGQRVHLLPSGQSAQISRIVTADGDLAEARSGQAVTITLTTEVDASRGDVIVADTNPPPVASEVDARIFWMGSDALTPSRRLIVRAGTAQAGAHIARDLSVVDLGTLETRPAMALSVNEIGDCRIVFDRPLAIERYAENADLGGFILIDPETNNTVALGLITQAVAQKENWVDTAKRLYETGAVAARRRRSFAKALSWRVIGSLSTFALAWIITGNLMLASSIVAAEIAAKTAFYYLHERAWSLVSWGWPAR